MRFLGTVRPFSKLVQLISSKTILLFGQIFPVFTYYQVDSLWAMHSLLYHHRKGQKEYTEKNVHWPNSSQSLHFHLSGWGASPKLLVSLITLSPDDSHSEQDQSPPLPLDDAPGFSHCDPNVHFWLINLMVNSIFFC